MTIAAITLVQFLWDPGFPVPTAAEIQPLSQVEYSVIKRWEPKEDGYEWLHGMAIVFHKGVLHASWGHNKGKENTPTEINQGSRSVDGGRTWSAPQLIGPHTENEGRSHGVFFSHQGNLWQFLGRFGNTPDGRLYDRLTMEAFRLNETTNHWESLGIVARKFWPCEEPTPLAGGRWIIGGASIPAGAWARPAVAISSEEDFLKWDVVEIPTPAEWADGPLFETIWGETTLVALPDRIVAIIRGGPVSGPFALVSESLDDGRTWTEARNSNLPMTTSKPYAGTLSTGQHYLISTNVSDHHNGRSLLTIAVTRPGEPRFCRMWQIRGLRREGSTAQGGHYPYAVEHEGKLYVAYSSSMAPANHNEAELAMFPISELRVDISPD